MKILVTGAKGQLGYDVCRMLTARGIETRGVSRSDFDIANKDQTIGYIKAYKPDAVIHCAAYTAVDKAEDEKELCYAVNVTGTRNVAFACADINSKLMYISTDYVFDGEGNKPFETDSPKSPKNYYGLTKSLGEDAVASLLRSYFIVRVSWVFGINGDNFVKKMLRFGAEKEEIDIVSDQIGSPTYSYDLSLLLYHMILTDKFGIYHASNEGYCSWAEFAEEIFNKAGIPTKVNRIKSAEYTAKAVRPMNSRMSKKSLDENGFDRLPEWKNALTQFLIELRNR